MRKGADTHSDTSLSEQQTEGQAETSTPTADSIAWRLISDAERALRGEHIPDATTAALWAEAESLGLGDAVTRRLLLYFHHDDDVLLSQLLGGDPTPHPDRR